MHITTSKKVSMVPHFIMLTIPTFVINGYLLPNYLIRGHQPFLSIILKCQTLSPMAQKETTINNSFSNYMQGKVIVLYHYSTFYEVKSRDRCA
jgi:hypothetical protein